MDNIFLKFSYDVIKKSNFKVPTFNSCIQENIDEQGKWHTIMEMECNLENSNLELEINNDPIQGLLIFFPILDNYVDALTKLTGVSFKGKYDAILEDRGINTIIKRVYRILKLLRNAMIHNVNSLNKTGDIVEVNYIRPKTKKYPMTEFHLSISNEGIKTLWKLISVLEDKNILNVRGNMFRDGILFGYYQEVLSAIEDNIKDEIGDNKLDDSGIELIKLDPQRYIVTNTRFHQDNGQICINNMEHSIKYRKRDFFMKIESKYYLVPEEYLKERCIKVGEIDKWEVNKNLIIPQTIQTKI